MSIRNIVNPTRVNKTEAEFEADVTTVYSENKMLVSTDVFYEGTNQSRFKLANGVNIWEDLDYVPAGSTDTNMAEDDLILDDDREHDAAGFSWSLRDLRQLNFESTSMPSGEPAMRWEVNTGSAVFADKAFQFITNNNLIRPVFEIRGNGNIGIGDEAQPTIKVQVYAPTVTTAVLAQTDASTSIALVGLSNGVNGKGGVLSCQVSGGVGGTLLGDAIGGELKTVGANGSALIARGKGLISDYNDTGAKADSAAFEVRSSTGGALLPRMTYTERMSLSPAEWLIVFQTNSVGTSLRGEYVFSPVSGTWKFLSTARHLRHTFSGSTSSYQNDQLIGAELDYIIIGGSYADETSGMYTSFDDTTGTITFASPVSSGDILIMHFT